MAGKGIRSLISNLSRLAGLIGENIDTIKMIKRNGRAVDDEDKSICIVRMNGVAFKSEPESVGVRVNLNMADAEALESISGFGPSRVAKLLAAREAKSLTSIGDLKVIFPSISGKVLAQCADTCTVFEGYREITIDEANEAHRRGGALVKYLEGEIRDWRLAALTTMVNIRALVNNTRGRGSEAVYTGVGQGVFRPLRLPRLTYERYGRLEFRSDFDQRVFDARRQLDIRD